MKLLKTWLSFAEELFMWILDGVCLIECRFSGGSFGLFGIGFLFVRLGNSRQLGTRSWPAGRRRSLLRHRILWRPALWSFPGRLVVGMILIRTWFLWRSVCWVIAKLAKQASWLVLLSIFSMLNYMISFSFFLFFATNMLKLIQLIFFYFFKGQVCGKWARKKLANGRIESDK